MCVCVCELRRIDKQAKAVFCAGKEGNFSFYCRLLPMIGVFAAILQSSVAVHGCVKPCRLQVLGCLQRLDFDRTCIRSTHEKWSCSEASFFTWFPGNLCLRLPLILHRQIVMTQRVSTDVWAPCTNTRCIARMEGKSIPYLLATATGSSCVIFNLEYRWELSVMTRKGATTRLSRSKQQQQQQQGSSINWIQTPRASPQDGGTQSWFITLTHERQKPREGFLHCRRNWY